MSVSEVLRIARWGLLTQFHPYLGAPNCRVERDFTYGEWAVCFDGSDRVQELQAIMCEYYAL